jgi:hypothetical protein
VAARSERIDVGGASDASSDGRTTRTGPRRIDVRVVDRRCSDRGSVADERRATSANGDRGKSSDVDRRGSTACVLM